MGYELISNTRTPTCLCQLREFGVEILLADHEGSANVDGDVLVHDDTTEPNSTSLLEFRVTKDGTTESRAAPRVGVPVHTEILGHADGHTDQSPCKSHGTDANFAIAHEE